jgi:ATP-binding cassette, subfamily C (CFTR/MRP), member 1
MVEPQSAKMKECFKRNVERGDKHPLVFAIYETYKLEFIRGGACRLMADILTIMAPFTLRYLIQFATDAYVAQKTGTPAPHIGKGLGLVFGISAMQVVQSGCTNWFIYSGSKYLLLYPIDVSH